MRKYVRISAVIAAAVMSLGLMAADIFECDFKPGRWNKADFIEVKSSRWPNINTFRQEADHIVNVCPKDATPQEMVSKRAPETYAAMIYKNPIKGNSEVKAEMSFDYRMAPSIVIAEKPGVSKDKNFPEFRTHYEIVLYDEGINVWRHWFNEKGKQVWRKVAFMKAKVRPGVKYEMEVDIKFTARGPVMTVKVGDIELGYTDDLLPREYYAGIIACEGVNRFYEFEIDK